MRNTILTTTLLALVPVALFAATDAATDPAPARTIEHEHGWLKSLDTNGDGAVGKDEAQAAANARVEKQFAAFDTNHDGQITQDEIQAVRDARHAEMQAKFEARFKQADTNGDGQLSKGEVDAGMPMLARGFDRVDANKDGELTLDEVKAGRGAMGPHMRHRLHDRKGGPPADGTQPEPTQPPAHL